MRDGLVVIPTYNEIENISLIIHEVMALHTSFDVLVVDDASPDGTASAVKELQKTYEDRLFIMERSGKNGLGTAYIAGFSWGLQRAYLYIFEMDADFSHNPKDLEVLHTKLIDPSVQVVIGSRYIKGVNVVNWPMGRILLSWFASKYVKLVTGMPIQDTTAGFVGYKREVLETIDLNTVKFIGYAFQIEMKYKAYLHKFNIVEIPVIFTDRAKGESKMSGGIISEAIFGVLKMRFNALFNKNS